MHVSKKSYGEKEANWNKEKETLQKTLAEANEAYAVFWFWGRCNLTFCSNAMVIALL
jgi:hypothetical protein